MAKRKTFKEIREQTASQTRDATVAQCVRLLYSLDYDEAAEALVRLNKKGLTINSVDDYFGTGA